MRRLIMIVAAMAVSIGAMAQHTIRSEEFMGITSVVVTGRMKVDVIMAEKCSVDAQLTDPELKRLNWTVKGNVLTVSYRPSNANSSSALKVYITRQVTELAAERCEMMLVDVWQAPMLTLKVDAGAKVVGSVEAQDFDLVVSGNSVVDLKGAVKYLTVRASSSSKVDCRNIVAQSVTADASMGSELFVEAQERIAAVAKSGGVVNYNGKPALVRTYVPSLSMGSVINNTQRELPPQATMKK